MKFVMSLCSSEWIALLLLIHHTAIIFVQYDSYCTNMHFIVRSFRASYVLLVAPSGYNSFRSSLQKL